MTLYEYDEELHKQTIRKESYEDDSFSTGLLEYPQYTRPIDFEGMKVPEVLLNGNHKEINYFRKKESLRKTLKRRPDLLNKYSFSEEEIKILNEVKKEENF